MKDFSQNNDQTTTKTATNRRQNNGRNTTSPRPYPSGEAPLDRATADTESMKIGKQVRLELLLDGVSELELMKTAFLEMEKRLPMSVNGNCDLVLVNDITSYTKTMSDPV